MEINLQKHPERDSIPDLLNRGFVLVEVLVVSLIVAILAAVAVPMYAGYIKSQRESAAKSIAQSAAAAANIYTRRNSAVPVCTHGSSPNCLTLLNFFLPDTSQYYVDISVRNVTVTDRLHSDIATQTVPF